MTVKADRIKRRRRQIYQDTVRKAIVNCGMSGRQGVKFLRHIRNDLGRKFIVAGVEKSLVNANKIFDEDLVSECVKMEVSIQDTSDKNKKGNTKKTCVLRDIPIVYQQSVLVLMEKLKVHRNLPDLDFMFVKVFIDDGRGKLKISLALVHKNKQVQEKSKKFLDPFKETGVKKVMIIACSPIKETNHNLQVLTNKIGLNEWEFPFKIAADLSCVNKLLGLGNHKSLFCCYICEWNQNVDKGTTTGARKRTFASITSTLEG